MVAATIHSRLSEQYLLLVVTVTLVALQCCAMAGYSTYLRYLPVPLLSLGAIHPEIHLKVLLHRDRLDGDAARFVPRWIPASATSGARLLLLLIKVVLQLLLLVRMRESEIGKGSIEASGRSRVWRNSLQLLLVPLSCYSRAATIASPATNPHLGFCRSRPVLTDWSPATTALLLIRCSQSLSRPLSRP